MYVSGGARTSRQLSHFQVTKVVRQVIRCNANARAGAVKETGHFEVRKSENPQARSPDALFSSKKLTTFLVVALKTQAANAANFFTAKIKQIKRSDMVTFSIFCSHFEAKQ